MRKLLLGLATASLLLGGLAVGPASAQAPFRIELELNKSTYLLGEPINVTLRVINTGGTVITAAGFTASPFHLTLRFLRSDGVEILATPSTLPHGEGPPPRNIDGVQAEPVEVVPADFLYSRLFDARTYYDLSTPAFYRVRSEFQVTVYEEDDLVKPGFARIGTGTVYTIASGEVPFAVTADRDGDTFYAPVGVPAGTAVDCDDNNAAVKPGAIEVPGNGLDDDCNPASSDVVVIPPGNILVTVQNQRRQGVPGLPVRAFESAAAIECAKQILPDSSPSALRLFLKSIWLSCQTPHFQTTSASGQVTFVVPPGHYLVETEYTNPKGDLAYEGDVVFDLDSGESLSETLIVRTK